MALQPKNYHTDGGNKWVVNGDLEIGPDANVTGIDTGGSGLPEGGTNGQVLKIVDSAPAWAADSNTTYTAMTAAEATTGTATTARAITAAVLAGAVAERLPVATSVVPSAPGTAAAGNSAEYARANHVHPLQASVATLTTTRAFSLTGDVTAPAINFNGSAAVAFVTSIGAGVIVDADVNAAAGIGGHKIAVAAYADGGVSADTLQGVIEGLSARIVTLEAAVAAL